MDEGLGTTAVSLASGYSVQQIRDLEALGVIPGAPRAANGYRRFSRRHVRDLRAYRELATAVGPVRARHAMREIRGLPPGEAAALVSSFHIALNRERDDALAAREALEMIRAEAAADTEPAGAEPADTGPADTGPADTGPADTGPADAAPAAGDSMTISELAGALGVRASTLRFWEKAGLVRPERVATRAGSARRYPLPAIREARITAALRAAGYRIPDIQRTMAAVRRVHDLDDPLRTLDAHVEAITHRTRALLRAGTDLAEIITDSADRGID